MQLEQNDEIDLFSLATTIWDGKWKIFFTTILSLLICNVYILNTPNSYEVSSKITNDDQNVFVKYKSVNDILRETSSFSYNQSDTFQINSDIILKMLLTEFNDYDEVINVLSKNKFIINKTKDLDKLEKRKLLINFANKFKIKEPTKLVKHYEINLNWHDVDEGILLLERALEITLINLKNKLYKNINSLASSLDYQNKRKKRSISSKLETIRIVHDLSMSKRILYLTEHSKIAKKLKIIENKQFDFGQNNIDFSYFSNNSETILPSSEEESNIPYYLRGYKAIDMEIEMIKKRSTEKKNLMASGYIQTKKELLLIENDNKSNELREAASFILDDNIKSWINFNLEFAEVENLNNSNLYIIFSIIIGLITGILYVVLINSIRNRRTI